MEHTEKTESQETKKTWIAPAATVEQVSEVTQGNPGVGSDSFSCHS